MDSDKLLLLDKIASLYYEEGHSQAEIARQTGYSRSMISRFLTEAQQGGLVEIRVNHPLARRVDLERKLQELLCLKIVRVMVGGYLTYPRLLRQLGKMGAQLIEEHAHANMTIGVSWGTAVYETVTALSLRAGVGVKVVQLIGSLDTTNPEIAGPELTQQLAQALRGQYSILPAPLIVDSEATRQSLLNDSRVRSVMAQFRTIELALVGVGSIDPLDSSALVKAGYLSLEQAEELRVGGAAGDVCAIFYDRDGVLLNTPITRRIVGIDAVSLGAIPLKIGVAGGPFKKLSIIGASRAKLINAVVTDETTALAVLDDLQGDKTEHADGR